jgi:hypothetical protein
VPPALENRPDLDAHLFGVWSAFNQLSKFRQYGFSGPQPLEFESISAYLALSGIIDPDEVDEYVHLLAVLDGELLKHSYAEAEKRRAAKAQPHQPKR